MLDTSVQNLFSVPVTLPILQIEVKMRGMDLLILELLKVLWKLVPNVPCSLGNT